MEDITVAALLEWTGRCRVCRECRTGHCCQNGLHCKLSGIVISAGKCVVKFELLVVGNLRKVVLKQTIVLGEDLNRPRKAMAPRKAFSEQVFLRADVAGPPVLKLIWVFLLHEPVERGSIRPVSCFPPKTPRGVPVAGAGVFADKCRVCPDCDREQQNRSQDEQQSEKYREHGSHAGLIGPVVGGGVKERQALVKASFSQSSPPKEERSFLCAVGDSLSLLTSAATGIRL